MEYEKEDFKLITTYDVSKMDVENHLKTKGIYVYIFSGHGDNDGALSVVGKESVIPARYTPYKIQHMTLYACSSLAVNNVQKQALTMPGNRTIWNTNVSSKGWVEGYLDDANLLTDDILLKRAEGNIITNPIFDDTYERRYKR